MNKKYKQVWKKNVSANIFKFWQKSSRWGDADVLAKLTGLSRATIDKALAVGFMSNKNNRSEEYIEIITKFFVDRGNREKLVENSIPK